MWDTREHLMQATAKGFRLIQPEIVGQKGLGKTANVVVALTSAVSTGLAKHQREVWIP
jgi:hypothetical protein